MYMLYMACTCREGPILMESCHLKVAPISNLLSCECCFVNLQTRIFPPVLDLAIAGSSPGLLIFSVCPLPLSQSTFLSTHCQIKAIRTKKILKKKDERLKMDVKSHYCCVLLCIVGTVFV